MRRPDVVAHGGCSAGERDSFACLWKEMARARTDDASRLCPRLLYVGLFACRCCAARGPEAGTGSVSSFFRRSKSLCGPARALAGPRLEPLDAHTAQRPERQSQRDRRPERLRTRARRESDRTVSSCSFFSRILFRCASCVRINVCTNGMTAASKNCGPAPGSAVSRDVRLRFPGSAPFVSAHRLLPLKPGPVHV